MPNAPTWTLLYKTGGIAAMAASGLIGMLWHLWIARVLFQKGKETS